MTRSPASVPSLFLLVVVLGCGPGEPAADRGRTTGDGTVDVSATNPVASMDLTRNWPMWRGGAGSGVAEGQTLPASFGPNENVVWKVRIPGHGHSSPTIVEDRVYLATADDAARTQSVLALDRRDGSTVWSKQLHSGGFPSEMHNKSSHASCTVACDGERLFVAFVNHGAVHVTALDLDGNVLWQKEAGDFRSKFGYAPSPTLYKTSVIVAADHGGGGSLTSWDRETGELNWRVDRPPVDSYASPIVHDVAGKDQLLLPGARRVTSYDPVTGEENWSAEGVAEACVGTLVVDGDTVLASGGYPQRETMAIDAANGEVLWRNRDKSYVPSMLAHDGHLYVVEDKGIARCYDAQTGDVKWRERLQQRGDFSSSPILVGGHLVTLSEGGECFVISANPEEFVRVAKVDIADEAFASPVACDDRLYLRVAERDRRGRQEWLYCIGTVGAE